MKYKVCPLLVQSNTNVSLNIKGQSWTQTWFSDCLEEKCAAYHDGFCNTFRNTVVSNEEVAGYGKDD